MHDGRRLKEADLKRLDSQWRRDYFKEVLSHDRRITKYIEKAHVKVLKEASRILRQRYKVDKTAIQIDEEITHLQRSCKACQGILSWKFKVNFWWWWMSTGASSVLFLSNFFQSFQCISKNKRLNWISKVILSEIFQTTSK